MTASRPDAPDWDIRTSVPGPDEMKQQVSDSPGDRHETRQFSHSDCDHQPFELTTFRIDEVEYQTAAIQSKCAFYLDLKQDLIAGIFTIGTSDWNL